MHTDYRFLAEARIADLHRDVEGDRLVRRARVAEAPMVTYTALRRPARSNALPPRVYPTHARAGASGGD